MKTNFKKTLTAVAAAICAATMCSSFSAGASEIRTTKSLSELKKIESIGRLSPDADPDDFPDWILPYLKKFSRVNLGSRVNSLNRISADALTFGKQIEGYMERHIIVLPDGTIIIFWTTPPVNPIAIENASVIKRSDRFIRQQQPDMLFKPENVIGSLDIGNISNITDIRNLASKIDAVSITNFKK